MFGSVRAQGLDPGATGVSLLGSRPSKATCESPATFCRREQWVSSILRVHFAASMGSEPHEARLRMLVPEKLRRNFASHPHRCPLK